ncbi:WxL protein peptidoglycan domain-containing protein [Streptacidiphilus sp. EB129]|uniref:WxL protein peptidoglycan domain-containing protein n=1 Tax=Streptacidiphilus sp. EB129 TaxID=3156262 RepID=UPI0035195CE3
MFPRPPLGSRRSPRPLRLLPALLSALLLALCAVTLAAGPAPAADNGTWAVFPTPESTTATPATPDRQYYYLEAGQGATVSDKVSVVNLSTQPITFKLYGADAYNTPRDGGFALRSADQAQTGVGAWVHLARSTITVPARTRADIPFTLSIPSGALPGDHPGAIVALDTTADSTTSSGNVAVGVHRAVGARIYLRVSGPTVPALSVENVHIDRSAPLIPGLGGSTATVRYTLVNRGNVTVHPKIALKATGWLGGTVLSTSARDAGIDLLPGQQVQLSAPWPNAPQFDHVTLTLTATGVGLDVTATASAGFTAVPWLPVGLVLLALGAALVLLWIRRKRRHPHRGPWSWSRHPRSWSRRGRAREHEPVEAGV